MKKILFLFAFMLSFCFQMEAQNKTVTNDLVYSIYGGVNDAVTLSGTGTTLTGISKTSTIKDPYVRWLVSPYDSTQILRMKNTILIDK